MFHTHQRGTVLYAQIYRRRSIQLRFAGSKVNFILDVFLFFNFFFTPTLTGVSDIFFFYFPMNSLNEQRVFRTHALAAVRLSAGKKFWQFIRFD